LFTIEELQQVFGLNKLLAINGCCQKFQEANESVVVLIYLLKNIAYLMLAYPFKDSVAAFGELVK
jgi:hypothetical protein